MDTVTIQHFAGVCSLAKEHGTLLRVYLLRPRRGRQPARASLTALARNLDVVMHTMKELYNTSNNTCSGVMAACCEHGR